MTGTAFVTPGDVTSVSVGAGLELQQVTSREKEKSMLDRQHEHLIRCLEKATVRRSKKNKPEYPVSFSVLNILS